MGFCPQGQPAGGLSRGLKSAEGSRKLGGRGLYCKGSVVFACGAPPRDRGPLTPACSRSEHLAVPDSCRLAVKAVPNAPRNALAGWVGGTLKVKVHAPALDGRASEALCEFLADELGLKKSSVSLHQGAKSRLKVLDIKGLSLEQVHARLGAADSRSCS